MKLVFFDTDFISNWHKDDEKFRLSIALTLAELERGGDIARMFTTVNYQELLAWGVRKGHRLALEEFLRQQFTRPVMFDEIAVREAAAIQEHTSLFPVKTKDMTGKNYAGEKDLWFRDIAMLGIARAASAYAVVTCSTDMARFRAVMHPTLITIVPQASVVVTAAGGDAE